MKWLKDNWEILLALTLVMIVVSFAVGCQTLSDLGEALAPAAEEAAVAAGAEAARQGLVEAQGGEADWMAPLVSGLAALVAGVVAGKKHEKRRVARSATP